MGVPNERAKQIGSTVMSGPDLIFTTATQASAAGGILNYSMVSCFGAKKVAFIVRTAAGTPTLTSSTINVDFGGAMGSAQGIATESSSLEYYLGSLGDVYVLSGNNNTGIGFSNQRFTCDRVGLRAQLAASATGVSCWAVVQWD